MKKFLTGGGLAAAVCTLALAPGALASQGPSNTGDGCAVGTGYATSCTWTADVAGSYAVATSGTYTVSQQVCTTDSTGAQTDTWQVVKTGTGGGAGSPGSLTPYVDGCGNAGVYQLSITGNGGGALGSVTGQSGLA